MQGGGVTGKKGFGDMVEESAAAVEAKLEAGEKDTNQDPAFVKELLEGELGGRRTEASFCLFGEHVQKHTLAWTNSPTMYEDFRGGRWKCTKGRPCTLTACGGRRPRGAAPRARGPRGRPPGARIVSLHF